MAQEPNQNEIPIQVFHNKDGWYFLPREYDEKSGMWLYQCPHCNEQIIIGRLTPAAEGEYPEPLSEQDQQPPQQQEPSQPKEEIQPESKQHPHRSKH